MRNIKLTISYDGSNYAGWQTQKSPKPKAPSFKFKTIQETVEAALQKLFREQIHLTGSGRTDSGVHSIAQTANFKTKSRLSVSKIRSALNGILPGDIVVTKVREVNPDFHAQFSAKRKTYRYVIINTPDKLAFLSDYGLQIRSPLNVRLMRKESACLLGRHDFTSFQGSDRVLRKAVTTIYGIAVKKRKGCDSFPFLKGLNLLTIDICAKGFLRGMVRNVAGTLIEIGRGRLREGELKKILKAKDRRYAGPCAPAKGLYLLKVEYE